MAVRRSATPTLTLTLTLTFTLIPTPSSTPTPTLAPTRYDAGPAPSPVLLHKAHKEFLAMQQARYLVITPRRRHSSPCSRRGRHRSPLPVALTITTINLVVTLTSSPAPTPTLTCTFVPLLHPPSPAGAHVAGRLRN